MPFAAGVKFSKSEFSKYYNPGDLKLAVDDYCVARDAAFGIERVGFVSILEGRAPIQMGHLPKITRLATEAEIEDWYELKIRETEGLLYAAERARVYNLDVKMSGVTFVKERAQVLIHFASERRVDFRELVKDLAGHFKARVEMWQIGSRQEAGLKGGIGICGKELCCSSWLKDFPTISMRYAKDQDIIQPPSKLSGNCGRLRCCLRYEHEVYLHLADGVPAVGCKGCALASPGVVIDRNLLKGMVTVRKDDGETATIPFTDFTFDPSEKPPERERRGGRRKSASFESDDSEEYADPEEKN